MTRIVVAGEALLDRIVAVDGRIREAPGGGPFNTARTIGRLGGQVAFLGRLSSDAAGRSMRATLIDDGVDVRWAPETTDPTTLATATLDAVGNATYRFDLEGTSAAGLTASEATAGLSPGLSAFHVGTLGLAMEPIATSLALAIAAIGDDVLVMVDPNCRPAAITDRTRYVARIAAVHRRADVVKVSRDDLAFLTPGRATVEAARELLATGPRVVVLTDGGEPVRILTQSDERIVPVPSVPIVDTVGAGDAFGGGFLARWIERGLGRADLADHAAVEDAVRHAVVVAGLTVGRIGADPPTRGEVGSASAVP
jgi:fructokinase